MPPSKKAPAKAAPARKTAPPPAPPERLETLGCNGCKRDWTRPVAKGGKPKLCPTCREDPVAIKLQQQQTAEEKKAAADARIDNLTLGLNAQANRPPRDYSLWRIVDRLDELEDRVGRLEER